MEDVPIFPDPPAITVERTLAIIKPDAIKYSDNIIEEIKSAGFTILQKRRLRLTPEQASDFYAEHYGKMFFASLIVYMHSDDIYVMVLAKRDAIQEWKAMIGHPNPSRAREENPGSLRARYGHDQTKNAVHGSDRYHTAEREIRFMFSGNITEPIYNGALARDYLKKYVSPVLLKGLTGLCKEKPSDPTGWLAEWLLRNNPNKPLIDPKTEQEQQQLQQQQEQQQQ